MKLHSLLVEVELGIKNLRDAVIYNYEKFSEAGQFFTKIQLEKDKDPPMDIYELLSGAIVSIFNMFNNKNWLYIKEKALRYPQRNN